MMRALAISAFVAGAAPFVSSAPANAAVVVLGEMGINENSNSVNTQNYNVVACDPCYVPFELESANNATTFNFNAGVTAHSQSGFTLNPIDFHIARFSNPPPVEGATLAASTVFPFGNPPSGFGNDDVVKGYAGVAANTLFAFVFSGAGGTVNGNNDAQTKLRITLTTVPLPAALPLLASALGGLGLVGWRRRRADEQSQTLVAA